jgi:hypothetical protein
MGPVEKYTSSLGSRGGPVRARGDSKWAQGGEPFWRGVEIVEIQ